MTPQLPPTPEKRCSTCFQTVPAASYRRRRKGGEDRMGQCRACHREAERARRACMADKRNRRRMSAGLVRVREAQNDRQVRALCSAMVKSLGGVNRFMAAWLATIDRDLKRGGYSAFRHFDTVIKLSQHCEQNRPCFSRMTDAELVAAVDALGGEGARK